MKVENRILLDHCLTRSMIVRCLFAGLIAGSVLTPSYADDVDNVRESEHAIANRDRGISITPYFWTTIYQGTMTVNGQTVNMSGTTVFDLLRAGDLRFPPLVGVAEWDGGEWGAYFDGSFIGMNFATGDLSLGPGPLTAQFGMDFTYVLINAGVTYTAHEWEGNGFSNELDFLGGIRYTYYDLDLSGAIGPIPIMLSDTLDWADGTLGVRVRGQSDNGVTYSLFADLGIGEGVSAQGIATIGKTRRYNNFDLNVFGGYRVLYQDWSSGNDAVNLTTHGPLFGIKFIF